MRTTGKRLGWIFAAAAFAAVLLHGPHPDHAQAKGHNQDCGVCRVLSASDAPSFQLSAPHFESVRLHEKSRVTFHGRISSSPENPRAPPAL